MSEPESAPPGEWKKNAPAPIAPWVRTMVRYLDTAFTIPGTDIKVGLDPLIGLLLPVIGDWVGALAAMVLLRTALERRVPPVIIARMVLNVFVDTLLGMIPVAGDMFDVAFRANQRNLELLERHSHGGKPRARDYLVVGLAALAVMIIAALPILIVAALVRYLATG